MSVDVQDAPKARWRWTAFRAGLLAGVASASALTWWIASLVDKPDRNAAVRVVGADVTRHGGQRIVLRLDTGAAVRVQCNGPCDDVRYETRASSVVMKADVLDAAGACVACDDGGMYLDSFIPTLSTIAGQDRLTVTHVVARRGAPEGPPRP